MYWHQAKTNQFTFKKQNNSKPFTVRFKFNSVEYIEFVYIKPFIGKKDWLAIETWKKHSQENESLSHWTSVIFGKTIPVVEMEISKCLSLVKIASFN